jgi:hypothetical protein
MIFQNEWVPLHWASIYGHVSVVEVLLKANADPNATDIVRQSWMMSHSYLCWRVERWPDRCVAAVALCVGCAMNC